MHIYICLTQVFRFGTSKGRVPLLSKYIGSGVTETIGALGHFVARGPQRSKGI